MALHALTNFKKNAFGPKRLFSETDLVRALFVLSQSTLSRADLGKTLGIGEGSVRTLLGFLVAAGFIEIKQQGCFLTKKGLRRVVELKKKIVCLSSFKPSALSFNLPSYAIVLRGAKASNAWKIRDVAVKQGAEGMVLLKKTRNNFVLLDFPEGKNFIDERVSIELQRSLLPQQNDLLLLCFSRDKTIRERSVFAAALYLLEKQ